MVGDSLARPRPAGEPVGRLISADGSLTLYLEAIDYGPLGCELQLRRNGGGVFSRTLNSRATALEAAARICEDYAALGWVVALGSPTPDLT